MLTKEYAQGLSETDVKNYIQGLFDQVNSDLDYMHQNQLKIKLNPAQYETEIEEIRQRMQNVKGDVTILRLKSIKKPFSAINKLDVIVNTMTNITGMINVAFYKYESKTNPIRKFKEEIIKHTGGTGDLYTSLMLVYQFYVTLEETQKQVTDLCKRARKNEEYDNWYSEMVDCKNVASHIVSTLEAAGFQTIQNEALSHTIYEVLIYEYKILCCKLDRYVIPYKLRYLS